MNTHPSHAHGSILSYVVGFALSLVLTLGAFLVAPQLGGLALPVIVGLALLQLLVQVFFFLPLGRERGPKTDVGIFALSAIIIFISSEVRSGLCMS